MTQDEFNATVSKKADEIIMELEFDDPAIAICACIEALYNIALAHTRQITVGDKLIQAGNLLKARTN